MAGGAATITWETGDEVQGRQRPASGPWTVAQTLSGGAEGFDTDVAMDASGQAVVAWKWFNGTRDRIVVTSTM
jgi:hypothetical protein